MTVADCVADLKAAFPRDKCPPETFAIYLRELGDLPVDVLQAAARDLIRTCRFFPSIAEIRAAAAEFLLGLPTETEALAQVEARLRWTRDREGEAPAVHPLVRQAAEHVGGFSTFRATDAPSVIRGQFLNIYRDLRSRGIRDVQGTRQPPQLPDGWVAIAAARPTGQ